MAGIRRSNRLLTSYDSPCPRDHAIGVAWFLVAGIQHRAQRIWDWLPSLSVCDYFRATLVFVDHSIIGFRHVDLADVPPWNGERIPIPGPISKPKSISRTSRAWQPAIAFQFEFELPLAGATTLSLAPKEWRHSTLSSTFPEFRTSSLPLSSNSPRSMDEHR